MRRASREHFEHREALQGGADFLLMPALAVGPFLSFSLGQYSSAHAENGNVSVSADIPKKSLHEWLLLGAKGTFGI